MDKLERTDAATEPEDHIETELPDGGEAATDADIETLRAQLAERDAQLAERGQRERDLIERYREALAAADPLLTPEDLAGDTVEDIDRSFRAAHALIARARQAGPPAPDPVPAGSPPQGRPAPVTPFQKIRDGLMTRDRAG
ncbi:MAG: hypothetical protein Kow0010_13620 [Dehalococcoidia bacterium]